MGRVDGRSTDRLTVWGWKLEMPKSRFVWKKPILAGLALLYAAIRMPEILSEGGWRAWVGVPVSAALLWYFVSEVRAALDERRRRERGSPGQ